MAELDEKLLKTLDQTLQNMNTHLQNLESILRGVKGGIDATFNPAIIKSFSDEIRGLKAARIIDADKSVAEVNKVYSAIQELSYMVKTGMKLEPVSLEQLDQYKKRLEEIDKLLEPLAGKRGLKTDEYLQRSSLYRERDRLRDILDSENPVVPVPLKKEEIAAAVEMLKRYEEVYKNIRKGDQQRAVEIANIAAKERAADMKTAEAAVNQREQAERRKAEIARAWAEQEAKEKAQREKMKTAAEKAAADERTAIAEAEAKKKSEIAKAWAEQDRRRYEKDGDPLGEIAARKGLTGTLAALEDQTAVNEWRKQTAEEQKRIAKEEAEVEKQIKKEIAEEEKKLAAEEQQRYQDAVAANKAMTKAEDDLAEAKRRARTAESKAAYTEDTKRRIEEERKASRERAQSVKEAAAIQKKADAESMANQRRQIQIKSQLAAIDKNRITITKQSSDREKALAAQQQADYRSLQSELSKLIARQKELNAVSQGSGRRAKDRLSTYTISESEKAMRRYADAVRNAHREQKKLGDETNKMLPTIQRLASAFGIAFSVRGLAQFGKKLIETRGEFERQQVALRSILQNKQLADEIWDKTMQAALQSPFTAMQLTTYTKQLAAYRIETDKLFETTKRLADVSAGLGVDMQRLILAYGQVKAANYLRASEIRQFTEAGVNVLGELRDYFNDVKGMSVDTAKVMEMVTKRLVTFEDVEAIFKRMTEEGGIFYEMQFVQSQTVRGQIAKLHDAYDQMLNSIGQAKEGTLKNFVALLNSIIKNWREWKTILDSVAIPALTLSLYKLGKGLFTAGSAARIASGELRGLELAGTKARASIASLDKTMKNFKLGFLKGWGGAIALFAVFEAATAIWNHAKAVKEVNDKYDELNGRLLETQYRITTYEDKIKKNNSILKDSAKTQKEHKEAQEENKKILEKLKKDYPEVADGMSIANNGIIAMTKSMKEYNAELRLQILLNERAKAGFFNQSLQKDAEQFDEEIKKQQLKLANYTNDAKKLVAKVNNALESGKIGQEFAPALDALKKVAAATTVEEYEKALGEYYRTQIQTALGKEFAPEALKEKFSFFKIGGNDFKLSSIAGNRRLKSTREEIMSEIKDDYLLFGDYLREMALLSENFTGNFALTTQEFIKDNKDIIQSMLYTVKDDGTVVMGELGYALSQAFADAASVAQTEQGAQEIINAYIRQFKEKYGLDIKFGVKKKKEETTITDPFGGKQTKESASKLISLIKEMRSEYDKLSKSAYGYAKSQDKVRKSYDDSVREILSDAGVGIDYDFTTNEGMIAALEKVKSFVQSSSKYAKDAWKDVQKYIDQLEAEIDINAQVKIREDFGKQMEKAFGDYELTLDIEKLNLPSDVLSDMFDIESVNLSDLRNKVVQFYEEQVAVAADPTDLVKAVEGYYKKIDEMERKQQRERLKDYAKYLEYELSERAKIEMEYVRKSAEVATTGGLTNEQKQAIDKRLKKERDEKLAKQEWEDFKSSETYIQMMEDLEHQGVGALSVMREELERIRKNAANLSPRALKEVVNALEKIDEITIKRGMPIGNILRAVGSIKDAKSAAVEAGLGAEQVKSRKAARETLEGIKKTILEREKEYRTLSNQLGVEKELARLESERAKNNAKMEAMFGDTFAAESDEQIQQRIKDTVSNIEASRKNIAKYQEDAKEADEETLRTISTKVAEEEANLECLQAERELLEKSLQLRIAIAKAEANRGDLTDEERKNLQERVEQLEEELKKLQAQAGAVGDVTKKYGILGDTWNDAFQKFGQWGSQVEQTFESFKGMMQALGTDVDTDTWDTLSTSFSVLNTATSTAASAAAKFAAGDYIGASLDIIKGLMDIATQIAELHDKKIDRSIEKSKERVDDLQKAYERLEKSIEKTFDTVSYMRTYNEEVQNLYEQIEKANEQINAAQGYKDADKRKEAIEAAEDAKQEALDALDEIKQKQIEVFGGIGEDNYRSAAEGFVDAWKSAFLETGDGLQALQEHFDEFLNDWFVKQATMRIAANNLEPLFRKIDQAVDQYGLGGANVTWQELQEINDLKDLLLTQTNEQLKELAGVFGLGGEGSLSGLAAGIQGMTEEQANVLEGYWNTVMGNTINIDNNVATIVSLLSNGTSGGVGGGRGNIFGDPNVETNPMLKQLDLIAVNTAATHRILESVTKSGHSQGGYGIKVFAD